MKSINQALHEYINELEIFDTHEHLPRSEELRERDTDVLKEYLLHYFNRDLVSSGMPRSEVEKLSDSSLPLAERWRLAEPFWEVCRHTGYGRALDLAARGLYGLPEINGETIGELDRRFRESLKPGWFEHVLKEKCRIRVSIVDPIDRGIECDTRFFRTAHRLDYFVCPAGSESLEQAYRFTGVRVHSFDDWLEACSKAFSLMYEKGAAALKIGLAYVRPLEFSRTTRNRAEEGFKRIFDRLHYPDWSPSREFEAGRDFEDYMMHFILAMADRAGSVVQIHTGMQEGNGNLLENSRPLKLNRLFLEYPNISFDLFHIGYPFQNEVGVFAKSFPNVYADMCWAHIISPVAARRTLREWIGLIPLSKIFAFGGDYRTLDAVYGHQYIARENVAAALSSFVEEDLMTVRQAERAARMVFLENPLKVYALS